MKDTQDKSVTNQTGPLIPVASTIPGWHDLTIPDCFNRSSAGLSICLEPGRESFFSLISEVPLKFERLWIFDADDTLWEDNVLYLKISADIADHVTKHVPTLNKKEVLDHLDKIEADIFPKHGAGPYSFHAAIVRLLEEISEKHSINVRDDSISKNIIPTITGGPYKLENGAEEILKTLRLSGDGLMLHTEGNLDIQLRKIDKSGLLDSFHAVSVVRRKSPVSLQATLDKFKCEAGEVIFVGNSLNSDIKPAVALNLKAIHYQNPHSWTLVNNAAIPDSSFTAITSLLELLPNTNK